MLERCDSFNVMDVAYCKPASELLGAKCLYLPDFDALRLREFDRSGSKPSCRNSCDLVKPKAGSAPDKLLDPRT
jgi:hypothetical protein